MNKRILKNISIGLCVSVIFLNVLTAFATSKEPINNMPPKNFDMPERKIENEIVGKITYIDENNVIIAVATRNEIKNNKFQLNEINENIDEKKDNNKILPDKLNFDDMFVLTGETKTINIKEANFLKRIKKDNLTENKDLSIQKNDNFKLDKNIIQNDNFEKNTYKDFSIGEYIFIETTDSTYTAAKNIRSAELDSFNMMRPDKNAPINNKSN